MKNKLDGMEQILPEIEKSTYYGQKQIANLLIETKKEKASFLYNCDNINALKIMIFFPWNLSSK